MNFIIFLPSSEKTRYGAVHLAHFHIFFFLLDGPPEPGARSWGCCRWWKRREYIIECVRAHMSRAKVISFQYQCYGATCFLCDCANFLCFLAPFPFSRWIYGYNLAVSVPSFAWGTRSEEKMQRILLNHSFRTLIFHWTFVFSLPWISPKRDPSVHFVIKNEENKNHFEKWSRVEKNVVERTNCCGNVLHLPFSLNRKWCFV